MDIVGEGYDAGIRLSEYVERDMVSVRLMQPFRLVVVGSPAYLDERGTPHRPEDLLSTGAGHGEVGSPSWMPALK